MRPRTTSLLVAVLLLEHVLGHVVSARADTLPGSFRAHDAIALCHSAAGETDRATRLSLLDRGLALAEAAVAADDADAAGHFAVFCNLGRRLQVAPLGWGSLVGIGRVRRAIDRALALVPDSAQLLTAKGVMLLELPRLLGGDTAEGERLLRRALDVAPGFADAEAALAAHGGGAPSVASAPR